MNRTNALRYFLLKHLWKNRHTVSPEVHRQIARSLTITETEGRDWNIAWQDGDERRDFSLLRSDVLFYRRGDTSNATAADGQDFREIANAFVSMAFRIDGPIPAPPKFVPGRTIDIARTMLWLAAGASLVLFFQLPKAAAILITGLMIVELLIPRAKLVLAGLSLPLSFLTGLPGALFNVLAGLLQFLDTRPEWRRTRTGLHALGVVLGMVMLWRHREMLSLPMIGWALPPTLAAVSLALIRWLHMSHRHMAPLAVPGLVWGLGCTGYFSASLFIIVCQLADLVVARPVPASLRLDRVVARLRSDRVAPAHLSALMAIAAAVVAGLVWWSGIGADPGTLSRFSPELVAHMQMIDTGDRRLAHKVLLLLLPPAALAAFWLLHRPPLLASGTVLGYALRVTGLLQGPIGVVLAGVVLWATLRELPEQDILNIIGLRFGLFYIPSKLHYLLLVAGSLAGLGLMAFWLRGRVAPAIGRRLGWALIVLYLAAALLPGLLLPPALAAPGAYIFSLFSNHHGIIFSDAAQLAHGMQMHTDVHIMYGMLRAVGLAIWSKHIAPLSAADGVMILKVGQVVLCLAAISLARTMARGRVLMVFLCLALVVPWFHTLHSALIFPNHAGWRFIGYALGFVLAGATAGWPPLRRSIALGACAGLFILLNTETGLCLALGMLGTLVLSADRLTLGRVGCLAGGFTLGSVAVFLGFLGLYAGALGPLPSLAGWRNAFTYFRDGASGFAGRPYYFDPFALLIMAHWSWTAIHAGRVRLERPLGVVESLRGGLAITGLLWLAYYVNGTSRQYLPGLVLLYGFFLSSFFAPTFLGFLRSGRRWERFLSLRPMVVAVVIGPMILAGNIQMGATLWYNLTAAGNAEAGMLSGVEAPAGIAADLKKKIAFLQAQPDREQIVILSAFGYFIQAETGLTPHLPVAEPYMQSYAQDDLDGLVRCIEALAPSRVLVDARNPSFALHPSEQAFQERFVSHILAHYRFDHEEAGWAIYVRREP